MEFSSLSRFLAGFGLLWSTAGCAALSNSLPSPTPSPIESVAQPNAVITLGRLEPAGEVIKLSVPNAQDSRVDKMLVREGDRVQANQVIAVLQGIDRRRAELRDAEAEVALRRAELLKAKQGNAKPAQLAAQTATIAKLQAQQQAETQQRRAAIASAQSQVRRMEQEYERRLQLAAAGAISQAELDRIREDRATAIANLAQREAELQQTQSTLAASIQQEVANRAELQQVLPADVAIAQAQLEKAEILVEQRQANLRDAEVRVPISGQILKINTRVGEQVNISEGIVELAQTQQMYAVAEVSEIDIGKVKQGQPAVITSEYGGFAGEVRGQVEQIALQVGRKTTRDATSDNPANDQNERVIRVKIRIDPKDSPKVARFTAMQVRVRLEVK
jgi:HlyD family secretion protein